MHFLRFYPPALGGEPAYRHGIDLATRKTVPLRFLSLLLIYPYGAF